MGKLQPLTIAVCTAVFLCLPVAADAADFELAKAPIPAFPGAEGFGAFTPGGRGGQVYVVTNLNDDGPGSFRQAVTAEGPRIVVFNVAGIIHLKTPVTIEHPFLTIAGQSAPGDGVCIAGETLLIDTHDVIIRYMRFRRGATDRDRRDDCIGGRPLGNIMIDHCSTSWGLDENLSIYRYVVDGQRKPTENVTIQWTISSEALNIYNHAFGGTQGGRNASIHHNLYASNTARNPSLGYADGVDWRNNVLFNWRHRTVDGGDARSNVNIVNNYYKPGPATQRNVARRIVRPQHLIWASAPGAVPHWYVNGNFVEGYPEISRDNWNGGVDFDAPRPDYDPEEYERVKQALIEKGQTAPWPAAPVTTHTAQEAYRLVLERVGATLPVRDSVDQRVIRSVRTGNTTVGNNGIINTIDDVGGWPTYKTDALHIDSDGDGMPDWWEVKCGLDPYDPSDAAGDLNGSGYTNIEEYLNGTDPTVFVDYTDPENNVNTLTPAAFGQPK